MPVLVPCVFLGRAFKPGRRSVGELALLKNSHHFRPCIALGCEVVRGLNVAGHRSETNEGGGQAPALGPGSLSFSRFFSTARPFQAVVAPLPLPVRGTRAARPASRRYLERGGTPVPRIGPVCVVPPARDCVGPGARVTRSSAAAKPKRCRLRTHEPKQARRQEQSKECREGRGRIWAGQDRGRRGLRVGPGNGGGERRPRRGR
ncbi:unnamed protein product [Amoebophrya sp. A120]|nr:unnamed protein product [Amoebophrya sp. A120]|eukprot:GSA120T00003167001.1